ncbi:MAG: cupin domain-containing protein, partial [Pseudomonadota bacterium]
NPQLTVKSGVWFGACLEGEGNKYCLVALTAILFIDRVKAQRHAFVEVPDLVRINAMKMRHIILSEKIENRCQRYEVSAENPQLTVKSGVWFGACLEGEGNKYCLVSCSVMPAFEFSGFELAERGPLLEAWPDARQIIEKLT